MSGFDYSVAAAVPVQMSDDANRVACALGFDALPGSTYKVPLSPTGQEPATHMGMHTWAQQSFIDTIQAARTGTLPAINWQSFGLTGQRARAVANGLIHRVRPIDQNRPNWQAMLDANGLKVIGDPAEAPA